MAELRAALARAVAAEDYAKAAEIQPQIKKLQATIDTPATAAAPSPPFSPLIDPPAAAFLKEARAPAAVPLPSPSLTEKAPPGFSSAAQWWHGIDAAALTRKTALPRCDSSGASDRS